MPLELLKRVSRVTAMLRDGVIDAASPAKAAARAHASRFDMMDIEAAAASAAAGSSAASPIASAASPIASAAAASAAAFAAALPVVKREPEKLSIFDDIGDDYVP